MTRPSRDGPSAVLDLRRWARRGLVAATLMLLAGALRVASHAHAGSRLPQQHPIETPVSMEGEPQP